MVIIWFKFKIEILGNKVDWELNGVIRRYIIFVIDDVSDNC